MVKSRPTGAGRADREPFQWIEAGWLLLQAALLIAVTIWLVPRRAA